MAWKRLVLHLVFFVSGAAALLYESLWFRQAGLALGNSVWAGSMVLASFMAGLALGNWLAGRFGHRAADPVRAYGLLEFLIAVSGLSLVVGFPLLNAWLIPVFRPVLDQPWILNPLRLGISFLLMLLPTAAMGATLPLMIRGLQARDSSFGERLGQLYACNTVGAMAGALACELLLIPTLGIQGSGLVAFAGNVLAGLTALVLSRSMRPVAPGSPVPAAATDAADASGPAQVPQADALPEFSTADRSRSEKLLMAAFLSGGSLLALEIVWFRFLLLFNFGTSRVFAFMLAIVLAGIAAGGLIASRWLRSRPVQAAGALPLVATGSGILTILSFVVPSLYVVMGQVTIRLDLSGWSTLMQAIPVMLPVSMLSGILFTLIGDAVRRTSRSETEAAGYLTLFNTTGAMLGALAGGFLLLPHLGMQKAFILLGLGYGLVAWLCLDRSVPRTDLLNRRLRMAALSLGALAVAFYPGSLSHDLFVQVASRYCGPDTRVTDIREGQTSTLMYATKEFLGQPLYHRLITDTHSMSSTDPGCWQYMKMYVYLPVALHPAPRKACLISYGCGVTGKALTDARDLEQIDVVDISRDILDLNSVVYPDPAELPLNDPRVRVHIEDGRFFLQATDERYDLITSEPPPPKGAGVVSLYTREYFQLIHDRLAEGGMVTYWLPHHDISERDSRGIVRAFCDVFQNSSLWIGSGDNWMLFAVRGTPEKVSEARFRAQWQDKRVAPILAACGFESPEQFGAYYICDRSHMLELCDDTPPVVDNYPHRISAGEVNVVFESRYAELLDPDTSRQRFLDSEHVRSLWPESLIESTRPHFAHRNTIHDLWSSSWFRVSPVPVKTLESLHGILTETDLRMPVLWSLDSGYREQRIVDRVRRSDEDRTPVLLKLGHRAVADRDYPLAERYYRQCLTTMSKDGQPYQRLVLYLACIQCLDNRPVEAQATLNQHLAGVDLKPGVRKDWDFLRARYELTLRSKPVATASTGAPSPGS